MLSESEAQDAIQSGLSVQLNLRGRIYIGMIKRVSSRGLWFEGTGGLHGTETIQAWALSRELSLQAKGLVS